MKNQLPSLRSLKSFESAARHLSFKAAAEELNVTPSAVSHQIKNLEDELGFALFKRLNRALSLTQAGSAYLEVVQKAFNVLRQGEQEISRRFGKPSVTASIMPFLANELVIPNLLGFQQRYPDIELKLEVSAKAPDFNHSEADIAIRFGMGNWPDVIAAEKLSNISGMPVCSPAFLESHPIHCHEDIIDLPLINLGTGHNAWKLWADHVNLPPFEPKSTLHMDVLLAHYQAVEQGLGIGIGVLPLVKPMIKAGRLVAPFPETVQIEEAYYLIIRPGQEERPEIIAFADWLKGLFSDLEEMKISHAI